MRWSSRIEQAQHLACLLLVASIPLPFLYNSICIWVIVGVWLISGKYGSTWRHLKAQPVYWLMIATFFFNAVSYFWTNNKDQSIFDSVSKLSFVVMPVVIGAGTNITSKRLEQILGVFILSITGMGIISFVNAYTRYSLDHDTTHFFYHDLVYGFEANAIYAAWYDFTALSAILFCRWTSVFKGYWTILKWLCAIILLVFLIFLSSRLLLAVFILFTIPAYLWKLISRQRRSWMTILFISSLAVAIVGTLILTGNPVERRYRDVMHRNIQISFLPDYRDTVPRFNNLTLRLFLWRCGMDNMKEHDLWWKGCGNGDEHFLQNERFAELGLDSAYQARNYLVIHNIDLHNMFMENLVSLGIPGLILFCSLMFLPFFYIRNNSQAWFFISFNVVCFLFMLQEAALQTQAGFVFYLVFSCIFWQDVKRTINRIPIKLNDNLKII